MGEAKPGDRQSEVPRDFRAIERTLRSAGVDVRRFEWYDQRAFRILEQRNPIALELYSNWVLKRPRPIQYDNYVRRVVPFVGEKISQRLSAERLLGACVNVATAMSRILDRMEIWSFAVRGSLTIELLSDPNVEKRYFPECDIAPTEDAVTGHGWLVVPPFLVVDATLKHQKYVDLHPALDSRLPNLVATESGSVIRPQWDDVVSDSVVRANRIPRNELTSELPYRANPNLRRIEMSLPGRDIRVSDLSLRYIAGAVTVSSEPLEKIPQLSPSSGLTPMQIWQEDIQPYVAQLAQA